MKAVATIDPAKRRSRRRASVRTYLTAAFAVTIVSLSGLVFYTSSSTFDRERDRSVETARNAARLVAIGYGREIAETLEGARPTMDLPEFTGLDPAVCNPFMKKFVSWPAGHLSIVVADGSVICSTDPRALAADKPYADADWLKPVLAGKEIPLTEPARDLFTGNVGVATILPFTGKIAGKALLYMASDMPNFFTLTMPELQMGTEVLVLDRERTIVLDRSKDGATFSGRSIAGSPLAEPVPVTGAIMRGVDGVERIYAAQTVEHSGWHVLSGIPTSIAFAQARALRTRSAWLGGATVLLVMALGFMLYRRLAKPVRKLTRAIQAAASDPGARAPEEGPAEIATVAQAFNDMNEARHRSEARFRALVLHASDLIVVLENGGMIRYCSPAVHALTGISDDELVGGPLERIIASQDRRRVAAGLSAAMLKTGLGDPIEFRVRHSDGSIRQVEALLNNLVNDPAVGGIVATIRDVTERKAFEDHLAHQALHDSLTGLPNRALVLDRLNHALARAARTEMTIGVLFLDLDRFKLVNDSHGHPVGDQVLTMLADRLTSAMRPSDTVARFGGDEFVALCDNLASEREVQEVATRMADAVRVPFLIDGQELFLTGSIGIAVSGRGESAEDLLRNADAAMYRAKELGRAQYAMFDDAMRSRAMTRLQTEAALHRAIESDGFFLHFQPKISLTDGRLVGAEALVRMMDPEAGMIPPAEFIDVAEETGLIVPIGEIVLAGAARVARDWFERTGRGIPISVNVSPRQLAQPTLPETIDRILRETGTSPELVILEITENLLMQDAQLASQTLQRLREIGVRVSIDDFGTGHSSLGYLREFPIDELKIDRSFVKAMDEDDRSVTIVGSVVGLAHAMGLTVVAEGVETAAQLSELRRLGCDSAQGFYFSHPRPAETMDDLLAPDVVWGSPRTVGQSA